MSAGFATVGRFGFATMPSFGVSAHCATPREGRPSHTTNAISTRGTRLRNPECILFLLSSLVRVEQRAPRPISASHCLQLAYRSFAAPVNFVTEEFYRDTLEEISMNATTKLVALAILLALTAPAAFNSESKTGYSIDSAKSKIEIKVAKDGLFKAFGHDHVVTASKFAGNMQLATAKVEDSSVSFTTEANSLRVVDPGESERDRNEVQTTMLGEQVLNAARYPRIQFSSSTIKVVSASKNTFDLQVTG